MKPITRFSLVHSVLGLTSLEKLSTWNSQLFAVCKILTKSQTNQPRPCWRSSFHTPGQNKRCL